MPATYTLKGKITDSVTGLAVRHATVKIIAGTSPNFGRTAITNAAGRYKFTGVKPEKIILEASLGYTPKSKLKIISANTTIDLTLTKA